MPLADTSWLWSAMLHCNCKSMGADCELSWVFFKAILAGHHITLGLNVTQSGFAMNKLDSGNMWIP